MRGQEFRIWDTRKEKMIGWEEIEKIDKSLFSCDKEIPEKIVMNYLGIKDRKGKKVFEGDIVKLPMVDKGKGDIAVFVYAAPNYYLQGIKGFYEISIGKKSNPEAYEVLGDIFRTPELKEKIGIELSIV